MSQFNPSPMYQQPAPASGGNGLALAALITACVGLLIPLVPLVAIVLAIIALVTPSAPGRSKGMAIAGLVVGLFALVVNLALCAGILLPAMGQSRQSARQMKGAAQVMQIGAGLHMYASDNKEWFPETPDGLSRLVAAGTISPDTLVSPRNTSGVTPSYVYLPPSQPLNRVANPSGTVVLYENPVFVRGPINVLLLDGSVQLMTVPELNAMLSRQGASPVADPSGAR